MSQIADNIKEVLSKLPNGVNLVAVSKFHPIESLKEAYSAGQRIFGESRAQELVAKQPQMPSDVEWHFIGHLQTNKIKSVLPIASLIHSVDSENLLRAINAEAAKIGKVAKVLLELHVAKEESKFGFTFDDCRRLLDEDVPSQLLYVQICGVMGMATNTDDDNEIRREFKLIHTIFETLKSDYFSDKPYFREVSMGMSDDYQIAVEEGSTMVRVGSHIFGPRQY